MAWDQGPCFIPVRILRNRPERLLGGRYIRGWGVPELDPPFWPRLPASWSTGQRATGPHMRWIGYHRLFSRWGWVMWKPRSMEGEIRAGLNSLQCGR